MIYKRGMYKLCDTTVAGRPSWFMGGGCINCMTLLRPRVIMIYGRGMYKLCDTTGAAGHHDLWEEDV